MRFNDDGWAEEKRKKAKRKQFWLLGIDQSNDALFTSIAYYACSKLENSHYVRRVAIKANKQTQLAIFLCSTKFLKLREGMVVRGFFYFFLSSTNQKFTVVRGFFFNQS